MARPIKSNADYFPHDSDMRNNVKVRALRRRYSHKGYAVWCFILEMLTNENNFVLDFSGINKELLAADFDVQPEELTEIVSYCIKIGLFQEEENCIFSESLKKRFGGLISKREAFRERYQCWKQQQVTVSASETHQETNENDSLGIENSQSKVNNTKQNNIKLNKTKGKGKDKGKVNKRLSTNNVDNTLLVIPNGITCGLSQKNEDENALIEENDTQETKEESCAKEERVNYDEVMELYNSTCTSFPKILRMSDARKVKVKLRFSEMGGYKVMQEVFDKMQASNFLKGNNKNSWQATFDWIFDNPSNWIKIFEGNYDNKQNLDELNLKVNDLWK